ncbi:hypothetical protein [Azonexus fungiphilus]|uniref:hypothetical protein n=1 Tax=Azonexus fungiphilus TaxID=146940 RepID=UPI00156B94D3|nr:hypothetical protein [Azonexus fungiphilus]NHC08367.1 hypothetical protein [Azonexus fungiphilus]
MTSTILDMQAFSWGILFTLAVVLFMLVRALTEDEDAVNQRAKRRAFIVSLAVVAVMVGGNWLVYAYLSRPFASFMVFPLVFIAAAFLLLGTPRLYRAHGGRVKPRRMEFPSIGVEHATREQQVKLWDELRSLPHFGETVNGDLISLLTGDRVYWTSCSGEVCLAIAFKHGNAITVIRYQTLYGYVQVQRNIAQCLSAGNPAVRGEGYGPVV